MKPYNRPANRNSELAQIHIAKKDLGWDDDFYRSILKTVCRVESSSQLDLAGRLRLLEHMRRCGWKGEQRGQRVIAGDLSPTQRKLWSLWQKLADAKLVERRDMRALQAFAKRQTGVERLQWLTPDQETLVMSSMQRMLKERG